MTRRGKNIQEERLFQRLSCSFPVQVRTTSTQSIVNTKGYDFSGGGMAVLAKESLPVGEVVSLGIHFSESFKPLLNKAKVKWARQEASGFWRVGFQFSASSMFKLSPYLSKA